MQSFAFATLLLTIPASFAATFDEQRATISASPATQPEAAIISLLQTGIEANQPAQAVTLAEEWLRQNLPQDATLLYQAGRAAELSGNWKGAVAFYQQFLKKADPKSAQAGDAITALHTLLINQLDDPGAAYAFFRNEAVRLAANPRFRQFDRWFLDEARSRKDSEAVANRLLATVKAGVSDDQLVALYDGDFRWLLEAIKGLRYDGKKGDVAPEFFTELKELAAAIHFDDELKLVLGWTVAVKGYNIDKVADGKSAPPLAEAKALLEQFPQYAAQVQDDWAGGRSHPTKSWEKFWTAGAEAKMASVVAAVPHLTPLQRAEFLQTWKPNYFGAGAMSPISTEAAKAYLRANPKAMDSKAAPVILEKGWETLSLEEARKLAPILAQNPSPEASLIRAVVAAGEEKDDDKAMAALLGPEVWRLGTAELAGSYADKLWNYCGKPGAAAKREQEIAKSKAVAATIPAEEIAASAPVAQRMALFKQLWDDFKSSQPKIPGVRSRLPRVLHVTPEAVPELLRDPSPEAQMLVRDVIEKGFEGPDGPLSGEPAVLGLSPYQYDPSILRKEARHRSMDYVKTKVPKSYRAYPLEPALRQAVADLLKQNKAEGWLTMAWINAQFMEDNTESLKLMEALFKSPAYQTLPAEVRFGARAWFQRKAMTPAQFAEVQAADSKLICKDLLALPKDADVAATVAALGKAIEGLKNSPVRLEVEGLDQLAAVSDEVFADPKVMALIVDLTDSLRSFEVPQDFGNRLLALVSKQRDPAVLLRTAAYLWRHVQLSQRPLAAMMDLIDSLVDEQPSAASTLALCGLGTIERHKRGNTWFKRETDIPRLKGVRGKTAMKLGLIEIPVAKNSPAYPIYQSQADWMTGNEDSAWNLLDQNWEAFMPIHREFSVPYLMWVLQRTIYSREEVRQETLVKSLLGWTTEAGSPLTPTEKAAVEIAYGDIAMQRGQLRQAHEIYSRTQKNETYKDLPIRHQAALRRARAERIAKNFDAALQTLSELELERVPEIWADTRYARAEVYFDMEEYDDAKDDIDAILARDPNNADSRILLGKIQLKRQKLMEATEVELGSAASQKSLVPGEKLKVTLSDPTLAVSGAGTEIEVVVWATSGDKEQFFLRQFGDQKTKFRGEVATALGAPHPGDDILQVIGDDEVFYAYSERFREKMNNIEEKRGGPITIASNAILMASARKLLTEAEQRTTDMETIMAEIKGKAPGNLENAAKAKMAERSLSAEARSEGQEFTESELGRYLTNVSKPGNPIHVRVIDPDRSRTAGIDELTVSVASSSGDSISQVTLKETGTHTGWFEGSIATTGAQALAFARDSEPGRNPNMVISPAANTYPAWRPVPAKGTAPEFRVDLNDNAALGELTIKAAEAGAKLESFILQTGMNEGDMTTVAVYPRDQIAAKQPWNPSVTVMNDTDIYHVKGGRSVFDLAEITEQIERGWVTQQYAQGFATNVAGPSEALPGEVLKAVDWKRLGKHDVSSVIYRFRGYFNEKADVTRRFRLDLGKFTIPKETHSSINQAPQFLLAVDGRAVTKIDGKLEGEINLKPGVHRFEIWATGWVNNIGFGGRTVKLQANLDEPDKLIDCPDRFFDPATFPEGLLDHRNSPAKVSANGDGTEFKVTFAPDSRARLLKLVFLENEGPVPALNKLTLTQPDGKAVLPVPVDFAALNKNNILEILTGDKISVRYTDDRFVTKTKERQERFLNVSFTDARAEFADMVPRWNGKHQMDMPYYEKLLRFPYNEPLSLAIHDADMDVSVKPDKVKVTLKSDAGGTHEFEAVETGDSTGVFKLIVTPVAGTASGDQIQVANGGTITATYLDQENNRPGVPTERVATIVHAAITPPQLLLSNATVTPLEGEAMRPLINGFERRDDHGENNNTLASESVRPRWQIENQMLPSTEAPTGGFAAVHGRRMYLELIAPQMALGVASTVTLYAQTDAGRRRATAKVTGAAFDITVPGTIALSGRTGVQFDHQDPWRTVPELSIYQGGSVQNSSEEQFDRFKMTVPLVAGLLPNFGALNAEQRKEMELQAKTSRSAGEELDQRIDGLVVQPGEQVYFGFRYTDGAGKEQWLTASTKVITQPVFDLMEEDYRTPMTSAFVGETLNLRVVDLGADVSDESDTVNVLVQAKSGAKQPVELRESGPHTGIFKASYVLSYADAKKTEPTAEGEDAAQHDVRREGFPVVYDDTLAARYTDGNGVKTETAMVTISKGADGSIKPFSKIYGDPEIAMRTQFSLAEAYLEMAKRHRKLDQPEAAAIEYASAKQLLSKAMDQFTDAETRAHAEYLLGNLTMEEADTTEDAELKETRYRAALSRFLSVTGSYSQTLYASKAQYMIASLYERLQEPEIAAQEYVKLAYKYPDSEYLATSMAKLGSHFLKTASAYEKQAEPLLAKQEDKDAQFEGQALQKMAVREYLKTAQIFGRLQERFPSDELAGQAGLRSGQAYMRADKKPEAIAAFQRVISEQSYDGPEIRSQAMYWAGMCYLDIRQQMAAYSIFKRLTYDFPESKWAAYARGQLSQESLLKLENKLELERLEDGK